MTMSVVVIINWLLRWLIVLLSMVINIISLMLLYIIVMCAIDVNQLRWKRWLLRLRLIRDYTVPRTATINTVSGIRK